MSKRNKIIISIIAVIVLIIIAILIWWFLQRGGLLQSTTNTNQTATAPQQLPIVSGLTNSSAVRIEEPKVEATLRAVAMTFTERFGSYSNQSGFQNLEDLQDLMTVKMKGWADNFVLEQRTLFTDNEVYYGITTSALSSVIVDFDESLGRAEVVVDNQRQESRGSTINPKVLYQKIQLRLVKTSSGWKVDEAIWQ